MSSEISNQGNPANQHSDWLSQVYKVQDREAEQVNGGLLLDFPEVIELAGGLDATGEQGKKAAEDIRSAFLDLFDTQTEILKAKLDGKILGAILSAYNDALALIK